MAKANLQNITTSGTFQNWFDKTNEIVNIIKTDTLTAGGDTTNGNATLVGNFTATNVIANTLLQTDGIGPKTGGATIQVNSDTKINGTSQNALIVSHGTGGQAQFTNGSITWNAGLKDSGGNFIIDTGAGDDKFSLATNGMLTVPNITVTEDVTARAFYGDGSNLTGVVSAVGINDITDVTITSPSANQVLKYNGSAWVNGTDASADPGIQDSYQGGSFITTGSVSGEEKAFITGKRLINVPFGVLKSSWNDVAYEVLTWGPSGISVNGYGYFNDDVQVRDGNVTVYSSSTIKAFIDTSGNGYFTGDVTTNGSASDERLKENIKPLEKGLKTIEQIKTYTFNYKNKPQDTHPGVIAQEIEKLVPEVVYDVEMEEGTRKAVRYQQLVPLLINAIKELSDKVNDLEDRLKS
jgi:hypothetical protein